MNGNEWAQWAQWVDSVAINGNEWAHSLAMNGTQWQWMVKFIGNEWQWIGPFIGNEWQWMGPMGPMGPMDPMGPMSPMGSMDPMGPHWMEMNGNEWAHSLAMNGNEWQWFLKFRRNFDFIENCRIFDFKSIFPILGSSELRWNWNLIRKYTKRPKWKKRAMGIHKSTYWYKNSQKNWKFENLQKFLPHGIHAGSQ